MSYMKQLDLLLAEADFVNTDESGVHDIMEITEVTNTNTNTDTVDPVVAFVGSLSMKKLHHKVCITSGCCSNCAHCGMELSDSLSIESGMGPVCRGKGFNDEGVKEGADEMQAMIALAEFPEVCQFLVKNYHAQGLRKLMNGIVRTASLNRGNVELHAACCDAVEALGWTKLANTLRDSISVVLIKHSTIHIGCIEVRVKKHAYKWEWMRDMKEIQGVFYDRALGRMIVPIKDPITEKLLTCTFKGEITTRRMAFWTTLVSNYNGCCGKTVGRGGFKITAKHCQLNS